MINTYTDSNVDRVLGTNDFVELARKGRMILDQKQKYMYDRSARKLKPISIGTKVRVQHPETKK